MRRLYPLWLPLLLLLFTPLTTAWGQLSNYYFAYTTGDPVPMTSPSVLYTGAPGDANNIFQIGLGFNFGFNGNTYSTVSFSNNGIVYFGSVAPFDPNNAFNGAGAYPFVAPFWDDLRMGRELFAGCNPVAAPRMQFQLSGAPPNRVFTLEWKEIILGSFNNTRNNLPLGTFQVRLYETTNKIEFWYGAMNNCDVCNRARGCFTTTASVGICSAPGQFMSVSMANGTPSVSRTVANDNFNIEPTTGSPIPPNTILVFGECVAALNGRIGPDNGGTATVANGDTFFSGLEVQMGESAIYRPFDIRMISAICTAPYTLSITGPAAADYYFGTPGTQSVTRTLAIGGETQIPEITFKPTATGVRSATLTVTAQGLTRTFNLAASAPFFNYTGNVSQGGTLKMLTGDVLLENIRVRRNTTRTFTPFMLTNMSTIARPVTYTITGGNGQYSITPGGTVNPGESTTPTITFNPTGFGIQTATLQVSAGGQIRTFTLKAISAAPGADLRVGTTRLDTNATLYANTYGCVGGDPQVIRVDVENIGYEPYTISSVAFYEIDTLIRQGIPHYAFRRDAQGNLIPSNDYVVTLQQPTPPYSTTVPNIFPITLTESQKMSFYVSFVGTMPGKRYARGYLFTNGENIASPNTNGTLTEGLVSFELFGRGQGARLSGDMNGKLPKAVIFPGTKLGNTSQATLHLANPGICSLRVSMPKLQITSGDVDEFAIVTMPTGSVDPVTQDLVLAPGQSSDIVLSFTPVQAGSRRASLRLVTNDSTIVVPGITERGVYYIDLFGSGGTDLYAQGVEFGQALIDGTGPEQLHDVARIVNTKSVALTINAITIEGTNQGDFTEDPAHPWPATLVMQPGDELQLGVIFAPQGGTPGERTATLKLSTSLGVDVVASLKGIAGTRTMEVNPPAITFVGTSFGKYQRKMVTITNTGTMTMRLAPPQITGPDAGNFQLGTLGRTEIEAGSSVTLEVTYVPVSTGTFSASLSIAGNATNAPLEVLLNGTAFIPNGPHNPDGTVPVTGIEDGVGRGDNLNVSGVTGEQTVDGVTLYQSTPNPANESAEIRYNLSKTTSMELALYDAQGRVVRVLESGTQQAGERTIRVDVRSLANGTYFYRLTANGRTLSRTMTIAR